MMSSRPPGSSMLVGRRRFLVGIARRWPQRSSSAGPQAPRPQRSPRTAVLLSHPYGREADGHLSRARRGDPRRARQRSTTICATFAPSRPTTSTSHLLDALHALYTTFDARGNFEVISGYRSPHTNAALRHVTQRRRREQPAHSGPCDRRAAHERQDRGAARCRTRAAAAAASAITPSRTSSTSTRASLRTW